MLETPPSDKACASSFAKSIALEGKVMSSSKVGVSEGVSLGCENWWETLLDEKEENTAVDNMMWFPGAKDGEFELWDEELALHHFLP